MVRCRVLAAFSLALLGCIGCTSRADDLRRAQASFSEARYEDVDVWVAALASDVARMKPLERAQYYYLAGMSAYRMGERPRARHALALCRAQLELSGSALAPHDQRNLQSALEDLAKN